MKVGDKVILLKDIWDDGADNHYPPGYIAKAGESLIVRRAPVGPTFDKSIGVSHEQVTDRSFTIYEGEYESSHD